RASSAASSRASCSTRSSAPPAAAEPTLCLRLRPLDILGRPTRFEPHESPMSVIQSLRSFDGNVARVEAAIATIVLLLMILVAVAQALLRTATGFQIELANQALQHFGWADPVLQKGTLWVAFLGASLATHGEKH